MPAHIQLRRPCSLVMTACLPTCCSCGNPRALSTVPHCQVREQVAVGCIPRKSCFPSLVTPAPTPVLHKQPFLLHIPPPPVELAAGRQAGSGCQKACHRWKINCESLKPIFRLEKSGPSTPLTPHPFSPTPVVAQGFGRWDTAHTRPRAVTS